MSAVAVQKRAELSPLPHVATTQLALCPCAMHCDNCTVLLLAPILNHQTTRGTMAVQPRTKSCTLNSTGQLTYLPQLLSTEHPTIVLTLFIRSAVELCNTQTTHTSYPRSTTAKLPCNNKAKLSSGCRVKCCCCVYSLTRALDRPPDGPLQTLLLLLLLLLLLQHT